MGMSNSDKADFIRALDDFCLQNGGRLEDYSGRAMYGKRCIAYFPEDEYFEPFELGVYLGWHARCEGKDVRSVPAPCTDSMGRGIVVYWPRIEWPEGRERPSEMEEEY